MAALHGTENHGSSEASAGWRVDIAVHGDMGDRLGPFTIEYQGKHAWFVWFFVSSAGGPETP